MINIKGAFFIWKIKILLYIVYIWRNVRNGEYERNYFLLKYL